MSTAPNTKTPIIWFMVFGSIVVIAFMVLLINNVGEWRQVSQTSFMRDQFVVKFANEEFLFEVGGKRMDVDSMRIHFSPNTSDTAVTITTFRREAKIIGEADETMVADVTVCGPPLAPLALTFRKRP